MFDLVQLLLLIGLCVGFAAARAPKWMWGIGVAALLVLYTIFGILPWWLLGICWLAFFPILLIFNIKKLRLVVITGPTLSFLRQTMPPMSDTEREAIEAGDTWWEKNLFCGAPPWDDLLRTPKPQLTQEEESFLNNQTETLCGMVNEWEITHNGKNLPKSVWDYLKSEGFFGLEIPKEYGGHGFSALAHSSIITKISTRSITAAVTAMVPNSLGPAELLEKYGTQDQKDHYLPRLAKGQEIPCFGLTSLEAGSDATSIRDSGVVCKGIHEGREVTGIRMNWSKRYITLAPVATVISIAFQLYDPEHLLSSETNRGITICLMPASHPGVESGRRHLPMDLSFMNGPTSGKDVFIPLEWIIGGKPMIGQGWRMLVECLAVGRAISLPAMSTANAKLCYRMTGIYAKLRKQFSTSIGRFEGVSSCLAEMGGMTYIIEATRVMTTGAVDQGAKPGVITAIAKYHMTEMARKILQHAMDIHAGRAVQMGPRNYMSQAYMGTPISITVEGANILTRNLIIFGQGAIRCHPYLLDEMNLSNQEPTYEVKTQFDDLLSKHIAFSVSNLARSFLFGLGGTVFLNPDNKGHLSKYLRQLTRMSSALAFCADMSMLILGGSLKRKENLSARLGDVLSQLYLSSCVIKYFHDAGYPKEQEGHVRWALEHSLFEIQEAFEAFFANFPKLGALMKFLVFPLGRPYKGPSDDLANHLAEMAMTSSDFRKQMGEGCYLSKEKNDAIGRMENAFNAAVAAEPASKQLTRALRDGRVSGKLSFHDQVEDAKQQGIISVQEGYLLCEAESARVDALEVDDFPPDYFSGNHA